MRDGRLSQASRAVVLRSCDLLLSDAVLPLRAFKSYVPNTYDNPLYRLNAAAAVNATDNNPSPSEQQGSTDSASPVTLVAESTSAASSPASNGGTTTETNSLPSSTTASATPSPTSQSGNDKQDKTESKETPADWMDEYRHMGVEWSMHAMDKIYNASFVDFVRNEKNCEFVGRHLAPIVKDYKLDQVVTGLRWLVDGWSIEATARAMRNVFEDWLPELAALAIAKIGSSWSVRPKMGLVVSFLVMGEKPTVLAIFVRSLTLGWTPTQVTDLISCLDTVLEWDDPYFQSFTELLIAEFQKAKDAGESTSPDPSSIAQALATRYKTSTSVTNYRIVLADLRLAVAKSNYLAQFTHSLSCSRCMNNQECDQASQSTLPTPSGIASVVRSARALGLHPTNGSVVPASLRRMMNIVEPQSVLASLGGRQMSSSDSEMSEGLQNPMESLNSLASLGSFGGSQVLSESGWVDVDSDDEEEIEDETKNVEEEPPACVKTESEVSMMGTSGDCFSPPPETVEEEEYFHAEEGAHANGSSDAADALFGIQNGSGNRVGGGVNMVLIPLSALPPQRDQSMAGTGAMSRTASVAKLGAERGESMMVIDSGAGVSTESSSK
ncbi:hypothetical protein HDV05_000897 [Chytridiales sp. JEL 0842]|nr:hypothetical protein HDV05_000897 [Chytridiales sp. JEL 0842]